jgi:hypothetical protein
MLRGMKILFALLLAGCSAPGVFCAVDRDGQTVAHVVPYGAVDAQCETYDFANLLVVKVTSGVDSFDIEVPNYPTADITNITWHDGIDCDGVAVSATWNAPYPDWDVSVSGECGGAQLNARFYGRME